MKKKIKIVIGTGIFCALFLILSVWHAVTFNDSRLVVPTDFDSYIFQVGDLPMIISVSLVCIYVPALFITLLINVSKRRTQALKANTTRRINPKLGYLGLLGFLGFAGFGTYPTSGDVFPFMFFTFFGFFGFFYEGKMSGTLMDERFRENMMLARLKSYKITFSLLIIVLVTLCSGKLLGSLEYTLIAVIIMLSLTIALGLFLPDYLLYRYDRDGQTEDSEE